MNEEILKNREILNKILNKVEQIEKIIINPNKSKNESLEKTSSQNNFPEKSTNKLTGAELKRHSEERKLFLSSKLNRSQYPEIHNIKNILPLALFILNSMKNKGIEDLTPPEISFILKEVFNIQKKSERISVALNQTSSLKYTDRKRFFIGKTLAYKYSISEKGKDYLKDKLNENKNG
jgi:hypothetical protein